MKVKNLSVLIICLSVFDLFSQAAFAATNVIVTPLQGSVGITMEEYMKRVVEEA